jgi:hypothetical protein
VDVFLENAQRIFDVARSDDGTEPNDFALLIRPDGGLHFVMESPLSLEAAAIHGGARTAYRVTKTSGGGVRVVGRSGNQECVLEQHSALQPWQRFDGGLYQSNPGQSESGVHVANRRFSAELLRDQPLYRITSPLTLSASSGFMD